MKKCLALLCAALLLACTFASAEDASIVDFRDRFQLSGVLPEGYRFNRESESDVSLQGKIVSDDPAAPSFEINVFFNESYANVAGLKDLNDAELENVRQSFSAENDVQFDTIETATGNRLLVIREIGSDLDFLDFYTICQGYEIELTLRAAEGQSLSDAQINHCLEFMRTFDVIPLH